MGSLGVGTIIVALAVLWASLVLGYLMFLPYASYYGPSPSILSWVGATAGFTAMGIPVFLLMMWLTKWFSDYRLPNRIKKPLRIGWVFSLILCAFMVFDIQSDHSESTTTKSEETFAISDNIIEIGSYSDSKLKVSKMSTFFETQYSKKGLVNRNVEVRFVKAQGPDVTVEKVIRAAGSSEAEAYERAQKIESDYKLESNTLSFPEYFIVKRHQKVREQRVEYIVHIPEGKKVNIGPDVQIDGRTGFEEPCYCHKSDYQWTMGKNGLYSVDWLAKYRAEKTISLPLASRINLEGRYKVELIKGAERKAVIKGRKAYLEMIEFIATENTVSFKSDEHMHYTPTLEITVPAFDVVNAKNVEGLTIKGFSQPEMEMIYHSSGKLKAYVDVENLKCELVGRSSAELIGSGKSLEVNLHNAYLDAQKYITESTKIEGYSRGTSSIYASKEVMYDQNMKYELEVFGRPTETVIDKPTQQ